MPTLSDPLQVGTSALSHRLVMAPLTRYRANEEHVHGNLAVDYYSQRAAVPGTLIVTEATLISPRASGYDNVPGIYNSAQIDAWKKVTDAVHKNGSYIWCQLWALGRTAKPEVVNKEAGGDWYVSSSATPMQAGGDVPRELKEDEIWGFVDDYVQAGKNAIEAGFDGVEIHGANVCSSITGCKDFTNHNRRATWLTSLPKALATIALIHGVALSTTAVASASQSRLSSLER